MYIQSPPRSTQSDLRHPRNKHEAVVASLRSTADSVARITTPRHAPELGGNFHFAYRNGLGLNIDIETIRWYLTRNLSGYEGDLLSALMCEVARDYYATGGAPLDGISFDDWLISNEYTYFILLKNGSLRPVSVWACEEQSKVRYCGRWYTALPAATDAYRMITRPYGSTGWNFWFRITTHDGRVYVEGDRCDFYAKFWDTPKSLSPRERFHIACMLLLDDQNLVNSEGRRRRELDPNWLRHLQ